MLLQLHVVHFRSLPRMLSVVVPRLTRNRRQCLPRSGENRWESCEQSQCIACQEISKATRRRDNGIRHYGTQSFFYPARRSYIVHDRKSPTAVEIQSLPSLCSAWNCVGVAPYRVWECLCSHEVDLDETRQLLSSCISASAGLDPAERKMTSHAGFSLVPSHQAITCGS